jgi:hypothetical protein
MRRLGFCNHTLAGLIQQGGDPTQTTATCRGGYGRLRLERAKPTHENPALYSSDLQGFPAAIQCTKIANYVFGAEDCLKAEGDTRCDNAITSGSIRE